MEGKLKEKLESTGIALLCMGIGKFNTNPVFNGCKNYLTFFLFLKKLC